MNCTQSMHQFQETAALGLARHRQDVEHTVGVMRFGCPDFLGSWRFRRKRDAENLVAVAESKHENSIRLLPALLLDPQRTWRIPAPLQEARKAHLGILRVKDHLRVRGVGRPPILVEPVEIHGRPENRFRAAILARYRNVGSDFAHRYLSQLREIGGQINLILAVGVFGQNLVQHFGHAIVPKHGKDGSQADLRQPLVRVTRACHRKPLSIVA